MTLNNQIKDHAIRYNSENYFWSQRHILLLIKIKVATENKAYLQNHHTINKIDALKLLSMREVTYTNMATLAFDSNKTTRSSQGSVKKSNPAATQFIPHIIS